MPADNTLASVLREQSRARGDNPLLVCDTERISYAEADRQSAQLARGLIALGAGKGTHVGLLYPNGPAFVVGMLAAARIGAVVVPFSTFATAPEMSAQLVHSDVEILLATALYRSHDYVRRLADILGDSDFQAHDRLFSTAAPQLRHVVFDQELAGVDQALLAAMEDDVDGSDLLATIVAGSTLVCSNASDAGETLDLLEAEKPNITNGFAAGIAHLARHPSFPHRNLSSMRRGNLYPIMAPEARPAEPELRHNMLGMTEAGSVLLVSGDETDQPEHRRGSYGKPAPGFDTKVIDPHTGGTVEAGEVGELCIRGPYVMQRYYKRSREECFDADGWFHTGDLVRTDDDGFVYFIGRRGAMIKTAGANVAPAEVERAIAKVTDGTVAHVVGIPDPERGQVVAAVLVLQDDTDFDEATLRECLAAELSAYKIPKRFVALPPSEIPLLSSGKVDLAHLVKMFDA